MDFIKRIISIIRVKAIALTFFLWTSNELVGSLKHAFCDCETDLLEVNWVKGLLKVFD